MDFYAGKTLNELFNSNPSDEQKKNSIKILEFTEKELEKLAYPEKNKNVGSSILYIKYQSKLVQLHSGLSI